MSQMTRRIVLTSVVLVMATGYLAHASHNEPIPLRQPLAALPMQLAPWSGGEAAPYASDVVRMLGVDEYVNRMYLAPNQPFVHLYVGFYASQRQGDTMHSPLNCLPGAGWEPVSKGRADIAVRDAAGASRSINVNELTIQKGLDRELVLYWYQSHGRVVASEYTSKFYMVYDAMRLNRTDAAMVRVITPILGDDDASVASASARARAFVQAMFPSLSQSLPS